MNTSDTPDLNPGEQNDRTPGGQTINFLVVTAFLNTMGAGVLSPVLPFIVQRYISNQHILATAVGWLVAVYALCQFVAAPGLGLLSDRFGRRPLLLICLLGSAIGYALFGLGGALWVLFLGRMIDGLTGGNVSILFAYIGDVSTPEQRTKYFGLIYFVVGVGDILMQGVLIGRILPVFGEVKLTIGGLVCEMLAYLLIGLIAFVPSPLLLWVGIVLYTVGSGLLEPSLGGLISRAAGPRQQGIVQGGSQAVQSFARILGPVCGGVLYTQYGHATPYWSGALIVGLAILATGLSIPALRAEQSRPGTFPS